MISERVQDNLTTRVREVVEKAKEEGSLPDPEKFIDEIWDSSVRTVERYIRFFPETKFLGDYPSQEDISPVIENGIASAEISIADKFRPRVIEVVSSALKRATPYSSSTGIVVAGFGSTELFPTLVHMNLYEPVLGALKYSEGQEVDVARDEAQRGAKQSSRQGKCPRPLVRRVRGYCGEPRLNPIFAD